MATWIEIPQHRVLKLTREELLEEFNTVDEQGEITNINLSATIPYRIIRKRDGKLFRCPRYHRVCESSFLGVFYIEEF